MKKTKKIRFLEGKEKRLVNEIRKVRKMRQMTTAEKTRLTALVQRKNPVSAKLSRIYYDLHKKK